MKFISGEELETYLPARDLVNTLKEAFRSDITVPTRHHHTIGHLEGEGTMLLMPAWSSDSGFGGVKMVNVFPSNAQQGLPSIYGTYTLFDQTTGIPLVVMDGRMLTILRTAAASVLAATYLANPDSSRLLMVGTGQLAPYVVRTYASLFNLEEIKIWGRNFSKAQAKAKLLQQHSLPVTAVEHIEEAAGWADIVSCATLSTQPLIRGAWLREGVHVDLIGGFTYEMRESDDALIRDARLFVDTRPGALSEAGDILQPLQAGIIDENHIQADLFELTRGAHGGRASSEEITCFKSVGTAIEDLAAAQLAWRGYQN